MQDKIKEGDIFFDFSIKAFNSGAAEETIFESNETALFKPRLNGNKVSLKLELKGILIYNAQEKNND